METPQPLRRWWSDPRTAVSTRIYRPESGDSRTSFSDAQALLRTSAIPAPPALLPVTWIDDRSIACLVSSEDDTYGWTPGEIVRWHIDDIPAVQQGRRIDTDLDLFIESLLEEHGPAWESGYRGIIELAEHYHEQFVNAEETPKPHDLRPFQLASQNVIIGLAAFRRDVRSDATAVRFWQTCDVPHVGASEGSRALSALMLCDAFQSGGTMEIRFDGHPEHRVPASLRRYGRTLGLVLGAEIPGGASISPAEARALFWEVTPMPDDLRVRARRYVDGGICSVERLCYTLLSPIWTAKALDFMMAAGSLQRVTAILLGGSAVDNRAARGVEMELMRAALLVEMLIDRLDSRDTAGDDGTTARLFEDTTHGVIWQALDQFAAIAVRGFPPGRVPWSAGAESSGRLVVLPRPHPLPADYIVASKLAASAGFEGVTVMVLTAQDGPGGPVPETMRAPVRLADLDVQIDTKLLAARLGRE
ncbi:hypothetical protein [Cryobacterium sp. TMS1-20-1]|uniref:hypothetical protein n=1 Tax=Cryobacterium sp. TMS1-20-1 TaxID=1259223 RepID=UPI00106B0CAE|nr:hypothetical protein [Cryobacterium sp. TMS1-20-1]